MQEQDSGHRVEGLGFRLGFIENIGFIDRVSRASRVRRACGP